MSLADPADDQWPRAPVWLRLRHLPEALIGAVMVAVTLAGAVTYPGSVPDGHLLRAYLALAVGAAACAAAWRWRWVALVLASGASFVAWWAGVDSIVEWNQAVFVTCLLVLRGMPMWWALVPAAASAGAVMLNGHSSDPGMALAAGVSTLLFAALGSTHRRYWDQVGLRAAALAAARDTAVARGVAEERLRIARELHDMIGHEIAVVSMRLGSAEVHLPDAPDLVAADLGAARTSIQTVLRETQRLLAVLRAPGEGPQAAEPVADAGQLPALVARCEESGLRVDATLPDMPPLSVEVSRAAYRIVQETLTNAAKHGTGEVVLTVSVDGAWLRIEAVNATTSRRSGSGFGLVGMRERAASVGGTFDTSREGNQFRTRARLPLSTTTEAQPDPVPSTVPPVPTTTEEDTP